MVYLVRRWPERLRSFPRTHGQILEAMHAAPRVIQGFPNELEPEQEDEGSNDHDRDVADDGRASDEDATGADGEHDPCDSAVAAATDEQDAVGVDEVILRAGSAELEESGQRSGSSSGPELEKRGLTWMLPAKPDSAFEMPWLTSSRSTSTSSTPVEKAKAGMLMGT